MLDGYSSYSETSNIYTIMNMLKQTEMAKVALRKDTPLIQIIDTIFYL